MRTGAHHPSFGFTELNQSKNVLRKDANAPTYSPKKDIFHIKAILCANGTSIAIMRIRNFHSMAQFDGDFPMEILRHWPKNSDPIMLILFWLNFEFSKYIFAAIKNLRNVLPIMMFDRFNNDLRQIQMQNQPTSQPASA